MQRDSDISCNYRIGIKIVRAQRSGYLLQQAYETLTFQVLQNM